MNQQEKDSFAKITELATERFNLYRLAASQHLTPIQLQRLHQIDNELPQMWDLHRREVASKQWGRRETNLNPGSGPNRGSRDIA
ncbi:MAG: DUF2630 family protein [bacterium]|nr:DUF2630 family protein [bacterium]